MPRAKASVLDSEGIGLTRPGLNPLLAPNTRNALGHRGNVLGQTRNALGKKPSRVPSLRREGGRNARS